MYEKQLLTKHNPTLENKLDLIVAILQNNPYSISLKTHKVKTSTLGEVRSSRVTSDLRILWRFQELNTIQILDIGKHSGNSKIYR